MNHTDKQETKQEAQQKTDEQAKVSANSPISPVEEFDVGAADDDRRIFQNGDTDRTSGKD
ncbi:hypothetical protein [Pseudorhizobium flavum]|uniref:hypothetical protein n=1 Tax=Pseudorhizobium flavum TaxID=1335061 RepID=UPI002492AA9A|nr:hypothetical protein [Pseudorhizobium flavum]